MDFNMFLNILEKILQEYHLRTTLQALVAIAENQFIKLDSSLEDDLSNSALVNFLADVLAPNPKETVSDKLQQSSPSTKESSSKSESKKDPLSSTFLNPVLAGLSSDGSLVIKALEHIALGKAHHLLFDQKSIEQDKILSEKIVPFLYSKHIDSKEIDATSLINALKINKPTETLATIKLLTGLRENLNTRTSTSRDSSVKTETSLSGTTSTLFSSRTASTTTSPSTTLAPAVPRSPRSPV